MNSMVEVLYGQRWVLMIGAVIGPCGLVYVFAWYSLLQILILDIPAQGRVDHYHHYHSYFYSNLPRILDNAYGPYQPSHCDIDILRITWNRLEDTSWEMSKNLFLVKNFSFCALGVVNGAQGEGKSPRIWSPQFWLVSPSYSVYGNETWRRNCHEGSPHVVRFIYGPSVILFRYVVYISSSSCSRPWPPTLSGEKSGPQFGSSPSLRFVLRYLRQTGDIWRSARSREGSMRPLNLCKRWLRGSPTTNNTIIPLIKKHYLICIIGTNEKATCRAIDDLHIKISAGEERRGREEKTGECWNTLLSHCRLFLFVSSHRIPVSILLERFWILDVLFSFYNPRLWAETSVFSLAGREGREENVLLSQWKARLPSLTIGYQELRLFPFTKNRWRTFPTFSSSRNFFLSFAHFFFVQKCENGARSEHSLTTAKLKVSPLFRRMYNPINDRWRQQKKLWQ